MPQVYEIALRNPDDLKVALEKYYAPAAKLIEFDADGALSKTSLSFLITFRASTLRIMRPLAEAWRDLPAHKMFSFRAWVHQDNTNQPKIVVIQRSGRHAELSALWIGMVIDSLASHAGDPALGVSQVSFGLQY
ncbi:type IV secretion system DNA-binding domain-containing protein [Tardiphaga sp. vice304]|uniref:type IV secretion system DNA-binding domain-containing protein n=1 Tax=Tardiphaga sp. vice304 TaxID=2592817 RepID=UPI00143CE0B8|nr:type IV secretion system DNA-binding domain-containing protein [Tardiphaga sp. vice304]